MYLECEYKTNLAKQRIKEEDSFVKHLSFGYKNGYKNEPIDNILATFDYLCIHNDHTSKFNSIINKR